MTPELSSEPIARTRPATSADVAKRAGVSRATVSYILNGTPGLKFTDATREAVLQAARELAYRPNAAAKSLAAGSGLLVLVSPRSADNEFTAAISERLAAELARRGVLSTTMREPADPGEFVALLTAFHPRAAVFFVPPRIELARRLDAAGVPIVIAPVQDTTGAQHPIGAVQVAHLHEAGRTTLAFAGTSENEQYGALPRHEEVDAACRAIGIARPLAGAFALDGIGAAEIVRRWHAAGVTGVCAYNDDVALAVLYGIRETGLRCPEDMAVIGCDDIAAGAVAYPPLSTIHIESGPATDWFVASLLRELRLSDEALPSAEGVLRVISRASS